MTDTGTGAHPSGQADAGDAGWAPQQAPATPEKKGLKKVLPIVGSIAAAGIVGVGALTGGFGFNDPEVGDCVQMVGETDFEAIGCDDPAAEMKIVGVDEQEMTRSEFDEAPIEAVCADFASTEYALWIGDMVTEPGTIYCTEPV